MPETPEKVEDGGGPFDRDIAGFRERLFEDYEPEELEFPEWSEGGSAGQEGLPGEERTGPDERASGEVVDQSALEAPVQPERPDSGEVVKEAEPSASSGADALMVPRGEVPEEVPAAEVEMPDFHRFPADAQVEHGEEVRTFEAVDYGKGDVVRIPKSDLGSKGFEPEPGENAVVRVSLRDVEGEEVETAFARYNASDRRAEVYVGDIGGEKGSRYELVEARAVDEDRLAREFEKGKCEHLGGVGLVHEEGRMFLAVDERRMELEGHRLSTSGSHVILRGEIEGKESCKIEFDGRAASIKVGRDYHDDGMRVEKDELVIDYVQSKSERHERRVYLKHQEAPERPSLGQFGEPGVRGHVELFERPEKAEGTYHFILDKWMQDEIRDLLAKANERGDRAYGMMKGEISERLTANLLESTGWERVKWHPFDDTGKRGADARGTDWLMRTPDGELVLMEIKWYEDEPDACKKAVVQLEKDFEKHRMELEPDLRGAFIAIVGYDEENPDGKTFRANVLRVRRRELR